MCFDINKETITRNYMQWVATIAAGLLSIQMGIVAGWASPNIARYTKNSSEISLTQDEITWVSSSTDLAGALGAILGPLSVQFFGPKQSGLIVFIIFSISWIFMLIAYNFTLLLIVRTLCGIADTMASICFPIFLAEVSNPEIRGTLISIALSGVTPGVALASALESYFSTKICVISYCLLSFTGMALLIFVLPETPYFLAYSDNDEKAKKSIQKYFPNEKIEEKLYEIQNFVKKKPTSSNSAKEKMMDVFGSSRTNKLLLLILILTALTKCSGLCTIARYMQNILEEANAYKIEPKNTVIFVNISCVIIRLITCNLIDTLGRRFLFVLSSIFLSSSLICLGLYFYQLDVIIDLDYLQWVPIVCIVVFRLSFSIGFSTGLYTLLGELCPPEAKNISNCLSYLCNALFGFLLTKIYLPVSEQYGEEYMFWFHALCALSVTPFVIFLLPETSRKKLEDI